MNENENSEGRTGGGHVSVQFAWSAAVTADAVDGADDVGIGRVMSVSCRS